MTETNRSLILSQDYELFFGKSGSIEKCLLEPSAALRSFASKTGIKITFFVDAGMLLCIDRFSSKHHSLEKIGSRIRRDIEQLHADGHEIALHIHPHWEDTRWSNDNWQFAGTRYRLDEFSSTEIAAIVQGYTAVLANITGKKPTSYRAGGFCIEPFALIGAALANEGIFIDSSVVPGASLEDPAKGFDFRRSPAGEWWFFDDSVLDPTANGQFLEVPVSSFMIPRSYYWGRLYDRVRGRRSAPVYGDGNSKTIGKREVARRLLGRSRIAEVSIDEPKVEFLQHVADTNRSQSLWSVMGHPKLLSDRSLQLLGEFVSQMKIRDFPTVSGFGDRIRRAGSV